GRGKGWLAGMGAFVLVGTMAAYGYRAVALPSQATPIHHIVEVPEGAAFKEVANQLAQKDLIVSPFWFRLWGKVQDAERKIQPGEYDLHTAMSPAEFVHAVVK